MLFTPFPAISYLSMFLLWSERSCTCVVGVDLSLLSYFSRRMKIHALITSFSLLVVCCYRTNCRGISAVYNIFLLRLLTSDVGL